MDDLNLKQDVNEFISSREDVALENLEDDAEYRKVWGECSELFKKIQEKLGDSSELALDYEERESFRSTFEIDTAYRQGLKDGLALAREDSGKNLEVVGCTAE